MIAHLSAYSTDYVSTKKSMSLFFQHWVIRFRQNLSHSGIKNFHSNKCVLLVRQVREKVSVSFMMRLSKMAMKTMAPRIALIIVFLATVVKPVLGIFIAFME